MFRAIEQLPDLVRNSPAVLPIYVDLVNQLPDRDDLERQRNTTRDQANEIRSGVFSLAQRRQDFNEFMEGCRTDSGDTKACVDGYNALHQAETATAWQTLADRAPQAIFPLFLRATLGSLYRYNMRMAGFHHSRADMLELLSIGRKKDARIRSSDLEWLVKFSVVLAADKVEFGAPICRRIRPWKCQTQLTIAEDKGA